MLTISSQELNAQETAVERRYASKHVGFYRKHVPGLDQHDDAALQKRIEAIARHLRDKPLTEPAPYAQAIALGLIMGPKFETNADIQAQLSAEDMSDRDKVARISNVHMKRAFPSSAKSRSRGGAGEATWNDLEAIESAVQSAADGDTSSDDGIETSSFRLASSATPTKKPCARQSCRRRGPKAPASSLYSQLFQTYRENLAPREGGIANRPKEVDRGGLTNKGMSQQELDRLRLKPEWAHLPPRADELTDMQINKIFHDEYFERPQIEKLAAVPGLATHAPLLAEQMLDIGVLHGIKDAGLWLQQAIDEEMGTDLRVPDAQGNPHYDGIVGSGTRAALQRAVAAGRAKEINNRIVRKRMEHMKNQPEYPGNPGWPPRAESFFMQ